MGQRDSGSWEKLVGGAPIIDAIVGGVNTRLLVDTGSQVTTVTASFYYAHFAKNCNSLHNTNNWLTVRAANGLSVPYVGYVKLDVEVCGVVVPRRGILVVKDSEHRTTGVCGLLGTNVLSHVPAMSDALRSMATLKDSPRDMTRVARVAGGRSIFVPSHSTMDIFLLEGTVCQELLLWNLCVLQLMETL